jgi:hypothetical protein
LHNLKEVGSEEKKEQGKKHACECSNKVQQTLLRVRQPVCQTHVFFSTSLVLRNCWVWPMGPPGAAGLLAQRGHVPFGLKEGRALCTTSRRFGSEDEKGIKEKTRKSIFGCNNEVLLRAMTHCPPLTIYFSPPPSFMLRNCWVGHMGQPGAAGLLAQRRHVPLEL